MALTLKERIAREANELGFAAVRFARQRVLQIRRRECCLDFFFGAQKSRST